ncbi:MAG: hypothetical protein ACLVKE_01925 [Clostridium baratii]
MLKLKIINKEYDDFVYVKTKPLIIDLIRDCISKKNDNKKKENK